MKSTFFDNFSRQLKSKIQHLKKADYLFLQNTIVENIYFVKSGRIKLIRDTEEGSSVVVHIAYAQESFAEASLFADKYHCYGVADCTTEVICFTKKEALNLLKNDVNVMMDFTKMLTTQIRDLRQLSEIKSIHNANNRVMAYLTHEADNCQLSVDCSLKDMAQKIGLAHETFYRTLKSLEKSKKIIRKGNQFKIL
jgi:CRP-like cAMP-binding protein